MSYKESICLLNPSGENQFPARFGNEIYYVEGLSARKAPYHYQSNFSLKYIFSGEEEYVVNNTRKKISSRQYLVVNDQSQVCRRVSHGTSLTIFFEPELIYECQRGLLSSEGQLLEYPLTENVEAVQLFDDVMHGDVDFMLDLRAKVVANPDLIIPADYYFELAHSLLLSQNAVYQQINQLERARFSTRKELYRRLNAARNYLEDTLPEPFDLDRLSLESSVSKFQLIRDFKKAFGTTPHRYFIAKKMRLAIDLINSKDFSTLNEVALELSYPNLSSFSRQFKQVYGLSPGAFRDN